MIRQKQAPPTQLVRRWLNRYDNAAMMAECPNIPIRSNNSNARTEENDKTETSTPIGVIGWWRLGRW